MTSVCQAVTCSLLLNMCVLWQASFMSLPKKHLPANLSDVALYSIQIWRPWYIPAYKVWQQEMISLPGSTVQLFLLCRNSWNHTICCQWLYGFKETNNLIVHRGSWCSLVLFLQSLIYLEMFACVYLSECYCKYERMPVKHQNSGEHKQVFSLLIVELF